MTATALAMLLGLSFAQQADVEERVGASSAAPAAEVPAAPEQSPAPAAASDEAAAANDEDERPRERVAQEQEAEEDDDEDRSSASFGPAIASASGCAAADVVVGALFGACGLCLLVSSQDDSLGQSIGQACSLFLGCPASLAVGVLPPLAALAGGCAGALLDDGSVWGAVGGATPGVLVGLGGLALIVTGLALGMETDGQGRDVMVPWPLAPGSPPTAPDSLAYTAGLGLALAAGPLTVLGAALGGMAPGEDDDDENGDDGGDEGDGGDSDAPDDNGAAAAPAEVELPPAADSDAPDGAMHW